MIMKKIMKKEEFLVKEQKQVMQKEEMILQMINQLKQRLFYPVESLYLKMEQDEFIKE